jgi:hypothetical protein
MRKWAAIALIVPLCAVAQRGPYLTAELDRDSILIGQQAVLTLTANVGGLPITWPVVTDTINAHVEVLRQEGPDTLVTTDAEGATATTIVYRLLITSFDSGYWAIPPFRITIGDHSLESDPLLLNVSNAPLGPKAVPKDIKPIIELPFSLVWWISEHWKWFAGFAVLLTATLLFVLWWRKRKIAPPPAAPQLPQRPVHERILEALALLEKERLWQQGDHKGYQSRLTDLLRSYIEERFQVPALERTTDELLSELRVSPLSTDHQVLLGNMLRTADMVKFAKALPSPQENEQLMQSALHFIRTTSTQHATHT